MEISKKFIKISFKQDLENLQVPKIKSALVIGGAGTIGSNYIKELLKYQPERITIVDTNENALTELTRDLRSSNLLDYSPVYLSYPVNLLSDTFDKIFNKDNFDLIANFAAHKHVRSEKDVISIEALIKNNVYGAIKLLELCSNKPPKYFFSVSTDKAAHPVNIMGASKYLMEKLILSKQEEFRVTTARFANVAFSNGSLLDGFTKRIVLEQPLSCPADIKRFFVTPKQSGEICLLATFLGDTGNIFFPKLDFDSDQIFFKDIAFEFLRMRGFEPLTMKSEEDAKAYKRKGREYPIYLFESNTSGEKGYEEFYTEDEVFNLEKYDSLGYIHTRKEDISFRKVLNDFDKAFGYKKVQKSDLIQVLEKYIGDFHHIETGKNLDEKM